MAELPAKFGLASVEWPAWAYSFFSDISQRRFELKPNRCAQNECLIALSVCVNGHRRLACPSLR